MRRAALFGLLAAAMIAAAPDPVSLVGGAERPAAPPTVRLVIDYGDGVEKHFTRISWRQGMTVLDVMQAAARHPRGIRFAYRGQGPTAFLTQIDDLANEGRKRNWIYKVNGKLADRSFASRRVAASDTILWTFSPYR